MKNENYLFYINNSIWVTNPYSTLYTIWVHKTSMYNHYIRFMYILQIMYVHVTYVYENSTNLYVMQRSGVMGGRMRK